MPDEDTFVFSEKHALYFPFGCEQLDQDKWFATGSDTLNRLSYTLGMVLSLVSGHWFPGIGFRDFSGNFRRGVSRINTVTRL